MAGTLNIVTLIGNATGDPEIKYLTSGKAVTNIGLAVNNPFNENETLFVRCVFWEQKAEFVNDYAHKGSSLAVSGRLVIRSYDTKYVDEDDKPIKGYATEVVCDTVQLLDRKPEGEDGEPRQSSKAKGKVKARTRAKGDAPAAAATPADESGSATDETDKELGF
jgi:single-strand DNA-binding protein